jgi:hypothetical protein
MPKFIIKMEKDGDERYLEWSTVVDAPVTYGMSYDEFLKYYRNEYGANSMDNLVGEHGRMRRVRENGTSERGSKSVHETISHNRAGKNETELDFDGIWQTYVVERPQDGDDGGDEAGADPIGDFYRLCAMFSRAGIEFHEVLKGGERIVEIDVGSTPVRFACDWDGHLQSVGPGDPQNSL